MKKLWPGYNVRQGASVDALIAHGQIVNLSGMVFTNDLKEAWRFKRAVPKARVTNRLTDIEPNFLKLDMATFLTDRLREFDGMGIPHDALVIHTTNEPDYTVELITKHIQLANEVIKRPGVQAVMLNLGVGIAPIIGPQIGLMHELLKLMVEHPDQLLFGHHSYGALVWTSGINGTAPPGYNVRFKPQNLAQEYAIKPTDWPTRITNVCYHVARWWSILEYCHRNFKKLPAIWETEIAPSDDIQDVEWWQQSFPKMAGDKRITGMWSCEPAWQQLFPGMSMDDIIWLQTTGMMTLLEQDITFDGITYPSPVVAASLYNNGDLGGWNKFDYRRSALWWKKYEALAREPVEPTPPTQPTPPTSVPKPPDARLPQRMRLRFIQPYRNLRSGPGTNYKDLGNLHTGDEITLFEHNSTNRWRWVETPIGNGWLQTDGLTFEPIPPPGPQVYTYPLTLRITAQTQDAADVVARYVAFAANRGLNDLVQYRDVLDALPFIVDTQVQMNLAKEESK